MIASARGRILVLGAAAACTVAAACSTPPPPSATERPAASGVAQASAAPTSTPRQPLPDPASVDIHLLDAQFVPGDAPVSANGQILWTAGRISPSEIWRYTPGTAAPERIFASPRAEANITSVVASPGGYAFVEQSEPAYGDGGWRVWFFAGPGAEPVQLDAGLAKRAGAAPTIAMDARRVVWAGFDERSTPFVSRLAVATIGEPARVITLLEEPVAKSLIWYPALDGDALWYGTIDPASDPTADGPQYHLETLDLANPRTPPVRFDGTGHDFNPAVNDRYLVWKANRRGDAALNWGSLQVLERASGMTWAIPVEKANRPSIGDRFVAFDEISHARLAVYDLATRRIVELGRPESEAPAYGGISVSGSLLTFFRQEAGGQPRIGWAMLPD